MKKLLWILGAMLMFGGFFNNQAKVSAKESVSYAKCALPSLETSFKNSKAVFTGRVLSVRKDGDDKVFVFQVENYWKGGSRRKAEVRTYENTRYQAWYQVGRKYLVFARLDDNGALRDGRCSGSKDIKDAAADIRKLGRIKKSS